jgi:signal transduction histidine kinase/DNA-binding response OmpR family regulator
MGLLGLAGWILDLAPLKSVIPHAAEMKANTASLLILASAALFGLSGRPSQALRYAGQIGALIVATVGLLTLGEYLFGWRLAIDELLIRDYGSFYTSSPGRMSAYSAVAFLALGVALSSLPYPRMRPAILISASVGGLIGATSLLGYIWRASEITSDEWLAPVAVNTALGLLVLSAGIMVLYRATHLDAPAQIRRMTGRIEHKVLFGFMAALVLMFCGGGITYRMAVNLSQSAQSVIDAEQMRASLKDLYLAIADSEAAQRNYLLTGAQNYRSDFQALTSQIEPRLQTVQRFIGENKALLPPLHELEPLIAQRMQLLFWHIEIFDRDGSQAAYSAIATDAGVDTMKRVRAKILGMDNIAEETIRSRAADFARVRIHTFVALLATLGAATAALILLFGSIAGDIRERARITKDLDQAQRAAARATQAKSDFLAAMSHEIRTPMNGVIGMVEVLHQSSLMAPQEEMVSLIRESADSLLTIIDDILDFSKIEAGRLDIEKLPMSVSEVVEKTCGLLNRLAERKGSTLMVFVDPAIPRVIEGDANRLRQILINLTNNAIKFSSGLSRLGHISVRATLAKRHTDRVEVAFQVKDNGIGMNEAALSRLFTSFTQADVSTTRRYGGTGLGLAISKQLANLMGGDISVTTAVDQGSTFTVRLPFALPSSLADDATISSDISGLTCLVIGDHAGIADDLAIYLSTDSAVVVRLPDLATAREWIASHPPGTTVCVVDAGDKPAPLDELWGFGDQQPKIVVVVIGRGQRRNPRAEANGIIMIDGNVLTHQSLTKAVAIAAGRVTDEARVPDSKRRTVVLPPSREEALEQRRLVLVAEDNDINQKVIRQQLSLLGYAADMVANGREALQRWRTGDYALLFTDLHMPEMDGYDLALAIRQVEAGRTRTPIVALTANALPGEAERCRSVGMDDYLSKPAPLAQLNAMLEKWLPQGTSSAPVSAPPAIDANVLRSLIGNDESVIREVMRDFEVSAARLASEISIACAARDAVAATAAAHKFKSSARSVGASRLAQVCAAIEVAGTAGDVIALDTLLPKFDAEMAAVDAYLHAASASNDESRQVA